MNFGVSQILPMENNIIHAEPTKEFFIDMLTRDVELKRSIIDLLDNSIDGAERLRPDRMYHGLWIKIEINNKSFRIIDNCGGIPLKTAQDYAFRFGRPTKYDEEIKGKMKHAIGRFGVGMKRALFKIGKTILVETNDSTDHYKIDINVDDWIKKDPWDFSFEKINNGLLHENGTLIEVTNLHRSIRDEFSSGDNFFNGLKSEIESTLNYSLVNGIEIKLNEVPLKPRSVEFLEYKDNSLKPLLKQKNYDDEKVSVKVFAGIGKGDPEMAGWYIYCNDRLVVEKDKTHVTGWKDKDKKDSDGVKFASKHAMFRGLVFFDAEDAKLLPLTTTKTGVDVNHPVYKSARQELMIPAMSEVFDIINRIGTISRGNELEDVEVAVKIKAEELKQNYELYSSSFIFPEIENTNSDDIRISYKKNKEVVDKVMQHFKIKSPHKAGEKTFDYFTKMEQIGDD